ncbi:FHA domain-containing protein [Durusdinium trenchii]|uniref:FHA domain-containing protein n=1 Tax=Durusdinium trenchii TaxID=1381693 RepID=A0ABP0LI65_9DINO
MGETRSRARHEKTRRNRKIENSAAISTLRTRVVVCASLVLVAGAFLLSEVSLTSRVRTWAGVMLEKSSSKSTFLPGTQPSPVVETPAPQLATVTQAPQVPSPVATPTEAPKERGEVQGAPIEAAPRALKSCLSFVHIPKAGGSNIEGIIARAYGYNQVVENPGDCISMRKIEKDVRFWGMCDDRLRCETKKHCGWSGGLTWMFHQQVLRTTTTQEHWRGSMQLLAFSTSLGLAAGNDLHAGV